MANVFSNGEPALPLGQPTRAQLSAASQDAGAPFGPYRVFERLGVGGMATVHRAFQRAPSGEVREVALKRLLSHLAEDESFVRAFVREAKLASLLDHPSIVKVYELGRVGHVYFMSMEYVAGRDLRCVLRQARLVGRQPPVAVMIGLMVQVLEGLDYAHRSCDQTGRPLGIVHRDVSPSNMLVTSSGNLKIIDFGIAKAQTQQFLTHTGRIKGKLAYMAPETAVGQPADARSDLFCAGIIAHELLTVRPLFASRNEYETLVKLQRGDILPPSRHNAAVPAELDAIIMRALAKEPGSRFATARQFAQALMSFATQRGLRATPMEVKTWCDWLFSGAHAAGSNNAHQAVSAADASDLAGDTRQWHRPTATLIDAMSAINAAQDLGDDTLEMQAMSGDESDAIAYELWARPEPLEGVPVLIDEVPDVSSAVVMPISFGQSAAVGLPYARAVTAPVAMPAPYGVAPGEPLPPISRPATASSTPFAQASGVGHPSLSAPITAALAFRTSAPMSGSRAQGAPMSPHASLARMTSNQGGATTRRPTTGVSPAFFLGSGVVATVPARVPRWALAALAFVAGAVGVWAYLR